MLACVQPLGTRCRVEPTGGWMGRAVEGPQRPATGRLRCLLSGGWGRERDVEVSFYTTVGGNSVVLLKDKLPSLLKC